MLAVFVMRPRQLARLELGLRCAGLEEVAFAPDRVQPLRIRLQILEVARDARLLQEFAHGDDVGVGAVQLELRRRRHSLDRFHRFLLSSLG